MAETTGVAAAKWITVRVVAIAKRRRPHVNWEALGKIPPQDLTEARMQAHWGVQLVAAVANSLVAPAPDDSHTSMRWRERMFYGAMTPQRFAPALRVHDLTLLLTLPTGTMLRVLELNGQTLEEAMGWVNDSVGEVMEGVLERRVERPNYYMDHHPLAVDARFSRSAIAELRELEQWFSNAASLFEAIQGENEGASPVRCWPHHFDMATLIVLDPEESDPEKARSINVGMSPGDVTYEQPYFYVNPWPPPQDAELPLLEGAGDWHTAGWFGTVLTAEDIVHVDDAELQGRAVITHIRSSLEACRTLLGQK